MMNISRLSFAHLPTPIEALPRLSDALGGPRLLTQNNRPTADCGNKLISKQPATGRRSFK
jgi:1-aminocyclopropane-1-carboxylate deaminase/D-cysteine desulfhydrase-like pyridoxal-dependent ACC family enzyme